jgi:hypothetical protein
MPHAADFQFIPITDLPQILQNGSVCIPGIGGVSPDPELKSLNVHSFIHFGSKGESFRIRLSQLFSVPEKLTSPALGWQTSFPINF